VPKLGVYLTTYNNPMFFRMAVLQVLAQTIRPHVLVIHENNHANSYLWSANDLLRSAQAQGMEIFTIHNPKIERVQDWYLFPIQKLIEENCDYLFKFDHDDIYYSNHIESLSAVLDSGYEFAINRNSGRLILKPGQPHTYDQNVDFSTTHGPGGMSPSMAFTRRFAISNVKDLQEAPGNIWEDDITARQTMPRFDGKIAWVSSDSPTACYVCYGGNQSSPHWACMEWARNNKHLFMND
jgi:hypothetical protein